ncbi:L-seryl-tRNA(Sec) selenium transferase [candidate division KSB3 bacterium]|uniref:L-seryl-tRNA(Sec) selenium transferase n=1 Tax=candidate division KSB3 bacterium TaxID=2044937 RepID=A0A9D5JRM3_9BACT|nr:L-seryl-tRNA(Sec) selenium transferase [candidate division KSB3 bacterium]MBD3322982.1 L-seryl-tRNA(Sec) selenium transferase [candidate division KSB3 bacterium]
MNQELLRQIPKVDEVLKEPHMRSLLEGHPRHIVVDAVRDTLDTLRQSILDGTVDEISRERLFEQIHLSAAHKQTRHLKRVINGTGIIVHTNLGRSNLTPQAIEAVVEVASHYSNLEYDLAKGARGSRYSHVEGILCDLLGCESALVVNNNAAAVLLVLSALGQGKEAIVSRGELVEIGGSFRVPDVIQQGGCILREVGTTNRTHLRDYKQAIDANTALILRVHTSNYRIVGFTKTVPLAALKSLADKASIPVVEDMGSGLLIPLARYGLTDEPTVQESLKAGVDVVTFSGDKLLGGPQAGIIVGKKALIDRMKTHPLTRALRVDKMTVAALEVTLLQYRDPESALQNIVTLRQIALSIGELQAKAEKLRALLQQAAVPTQITKAASQVGGGSLPIQQLPTFCLVFNAQTFSPNQLERKFRTGTPPIIGRIVEDRYLLDVRTLAEDDVPLLVNRAREIFDARRGSPGSNAS